MSKIERMALKFDICAILQDSKPDQISNTADRILYTILAALQEDKALQEVIERYFNFPHGKGFGKARLAVFLNASPLGEQSE